MLPRPTGSLRRGGHVACRWLGLPPAMHPNPLFRIAPDVRLDDIAPGLRQRRQRPGAVRYLRNGHRRLDHQPKLCSLTDHEAWEDGCSCHEGERGRPDRRVRRMPEEVYEDPFEAVDI